MASPSKQHSTMRCITKDLLLNGQVRLQQPENGFRVAIDSVLLAASVPNTQKSRVLDVGAGVGAAALCVARRIPNSRVTGLEIQEELAALAEDNAALNDLDERLNFIVGDISAEPAALNPGTFDHVITNPPYQRVETSLKPSEYSKALATVEQEIELGAWLKYCGKMAKRYGTVTVIHRADRLDEVLAAMSAISGAIVLYPLWPKVGESAKRIIIQGVVGRETPMRLSSGLVIHKSQGGFTSEVEAILRNAEALQMSK